MPTPGADRIILLTGATGYVGSRLLSLLERDGLPVRCLARRPEQLAGRVGPRTEVVRGDLLDRSSLDAALQGIDVAFYLVHSMAGAGAFEEQDRQAAVNFARAAAEAGVRRIIYLGGLGGASDGLSPHLRSRQEVGQILRDGTVQVLEFRASIIIGRGSLSFEMIRALVERLPVMVTPRWVSTLAQPIAIDDLLAYLVGGLRFEIDGNHVFEIGGPDRVRYLDLMREYARQRGLRRAWIRVPLLTPNLSSLWLALVTPMYRRVGRKLIDSIRNPTVVQDDTAGRLFAVRPRGMRQAIAQAMEDEERELTRSGWSDRAGSSEGIPGTWLTDRRRVRVAAPAAEAFRPILRIGGATRWYFATWLWRLRGWLDLLVGCVGMNRPRRDPETLRVGDVVDCWRVEAVTEDRLRLAAEMRLPGRAWLQFEVRPDADGGTEIHQTALFNPLGLLGRAYWYVIYPVHRLVFWGMLRGIARRVRVRPDSRVKAAG